jgi:hypothetical protein
MHYKLSKNEWLAIGNKAGWLKSGVSRPNEKTAAKLKLVKTFPAGSNDLSAKIYRDSDYDGYLVRFFESGKHNEDADYETEDLQDAIGTAEYSISHYKAERPNEKTAAGPIAS